MAAGSGAWFPDLGLESADAGGYRLRRFAGRWPRFHDAAHGSHRHVIRSRPNESVVAYASRHIGADAGRLSPRLACTELPSCSSGDKLHRGRCGPGPS